ncbi:hypothetical protein RvY_18949 [Ramazzottius varieornatus]|uniref:Uncharacterized protein n=1 Tax=Ramazzottius varieornatus TaxID=947166 RepID=A0A1D1W7N0_RAMVA|nr:hypothetical protein RvY_18949 [Ramazzottius varieornatus]
MTFLIKNQLSSYLEKYVKNFERDQLKLSVTKGRLELKDCDFNEDALTDLLELPTWLRLARVTCNRLYVKIGWRKIQHLPVHIHLDEVRVTLETCPELRTPTQGISALANKMPNMPEMKYRLPQKIGDGIYMSMNAMRIQFKSQLMLADVQLLQLRTYPSTPEWQETDDIAKGRVKNSELDETLIFRQMDFESMRVELRSIGQAATDARPIMLVTSAGNVRLIMKRRLSDALLLNIKADILLDNIQLTLSETEMKSTVDFVRDIMHLVKASNIQTRVRKAQHKYVNKQNTQKQLNAYLKKHIGEEYNAQVEKRPHIQDARARYYLRHAIWETSQHLLIRALDLTIVHDNSLPETFMEARQRARYADASMAMHLTDIRADIYPFHLVTEGNTSWLTRHREVPGSGEWINALLNGYRRELGSISATFEDDFQTLLSTTINASIGQFIIQPVVTGEDVKRGNKPHETPFLVFDKAEFDIPESVPAIDIAMTNYYYAKEVQWPVPKGSVFATTCPIRLSLDANTIDWMTLMGLHVGIDLIKKLRSLEDMMETMRKPSNIKSLLRVESNIPRIFFPKSFANRRERQSGVLIQAASIVITNTSVGQSKIVDEALPTLLRTNLFAHPTYFPNMQGDWPLVDVINHFLSFSQDPSRRPSLISIQVNDLWAGAVTDQLGLAHALPFLDAFSLNMWAVPGTATIPQRRKGLVWGAAIVDMNTPTIRLQLNDYTLRLLIAVSDGLAKLGQVGGEHMALLPKLGAPDLGLCLLMQQENIEISLILQEAEAGAKLGAEDALAVSNLSIAKESSLSGSLSGSVTSLTLGRDPLQPRSSSISSTSGVSSHGAVRSPLADNATTVTTTTSPYGTRAPLVPPSLYTPIAADNANWWQQSKYWRDTHDESEAEATDDEKETDVSGYESDEDVSPVLTDHDTDDTEWEAGSVAPFSWQQVGKSRRTVPLAQVQASLLTITLKSLQQYMMLSHGHMVMKTRLGHIVAKESKDVALSEVSDLPVQENDMDVGRPEYMDTILARFEMGEHSSNGGAPVMMANVRGLDLKVRHESVKRLQAILSRIEAIGSAAPAAPVNDVKLEEVSTGKLQSVPMVDIRVMNVSMRVKDAIEVMANQAGIAPAYQALNAGSPIKDLGLRIDGLAIQSNRNGIITVSALRDEENDEDEEIDAPTPQLVQRQLSVLNQRRVKLEQRIQQLHNRLQNAPPQTSQLQHGDQQRQLRQ